MALEAPPYDGRTEVDEVDVRVAGPVVVRFGDRINFDRRHRVRMPRGRGTGRDADRPSRTDARDGGRSTGGLLLYLLFFLGFGAVGRVVVLPFRAVWRRLSLGVRLLLVEVVALVAYVAVVRTDLRVETLFGDGLDGLVRRIGSTPDLLALVGVVAVVVLAGTRGTDGRRV
jgi:hypothetical protein